jgi:hypothetical protein
VNGGTKERYRFEKKMLSTKSGVIYYGKDLALQRDVLLYRLPDADLDTTNSLSRLSNVAQLADPRFLHMLDLGYDKQGSYAVLECRKGQLLIEYLSQQSFPVMDALRMVHQLGIGLQEALEERIRGFSLAADNLWYSPDHPLLVINYWAQGGKEQTGGLGLVHLMFQLITANKTIPEDFEVLERQFRTALKGISEHTTESLLRLVEQTYTEQYSLSSFLVDLGIILGEQKGTVFRSAAKSPKKSKPEPVSKIEESSRIVKSSNKTKYYSLIAIAFLLFISTFFFVRHILQTPTSASPAPVKANTGAQSKKTGDQAKQELEISSTAVATQPTTPNPASNSGTVTVPNLSGLTRENAEKQALASGIHYKFLIEPSALPAGTVFKQDLIAGQQVPKESTLTFWVSKGN